jgi:ferredoxin-nitrate reductase
MKKRPPRTMDRRDFLRLSLRAGGTLAAGAAVLGSGCIALFGGADVDTGGDGPWQASVCGVCNVGCGVWVRTRGNRITEVRGIPGHPVNDGLLCVKGIYQHLSLVTPGRAVYPLLGRGAHRQRLTWKQAVSFLAEKLTQIRQTAGKDAIAVYHGGQLLLEEYYVIGKFARAVLQTEHLDANTRLCVASFREAYRQSFGSVAPPPSYDDLDQTGCLLIVGNNTAEQHPILYQRIRRARQRKHFPVIVTDPRTTPTAGIADIHLRIRAHTDTALFNAIAHVIIRENLHRPAFIRDHTRGFAAVAAMAEHYPPERAAQICHIAAEDIIRAARLFAGAEKAVAMWMVGVNQQEQGTDIGLLLNNLCLLTGNVGRAGAGPLALMGQTSSSAEAGSVEGLPGYRKLDNEAHRREMASIWQIPAGSIPEKTRTASDELWQDIEAGRVRALWVIGSNPAVTMPDQQNFRRLLSSLELLVVQDGYEKTMTAEFAHLILPAALWGEKEGVFINSERRVSYAPALVSPPGEALPDWQIVGRVAGAMGSDKLFPYREAREIFHEWRLASQGTEAEMTGLDYPLIHQRQGIRFPSRETGTGTDRLYAGYQFPTDDGRARFVAAGYRPSAEMPDERFPFFLLTGRLLSQWQTMTKTGHIPELFTAAPEAFVEISEEDAQRLGVEHDEPVRVISPRGSIQLPARITTKVLPGHLFIPFHFPDTPVNLLTPYLLDPQSRQPALKAGVAAVEKVTTGEGH